MKRNRSIKLNWISDPIGRHRNPWTIDDNDYLKSNYQNKSDKEIGIALKRTAYSIQQQRYRLHIRRKKTRINLVETLHFANVERNAMIRLNEKVTEMRSLIAQAEVETNNYKKDKIKQKLKKLSGL